MGWGIVTESDGGLGVGGRNFVFGHNMSKRCMYANKKGKPRAKRFENCRKSRKSCLAARRRGDDR